MAAIKIRRPVIEFSVERIFRVSSVAAAVGEHFRPGVAAGQRQIPFALGHVKLKRIIVRVGIAETHPDVGITFVRPDCVGSKRAGQL